MMLRSMPLRFAAGVLIAAAAVSLSAASARAFNQQNLQSGGTDNAAIADPDDQFTNSGQGVHPFGANGPTVQFGVQQRTVTPFGSFQGNDRDGSPPDPYFHPPGNGNN